MFLLRRSKLFVLTTFVSSKTFVVGGLNRRPTATVVSKSI